MSDTVKDSLKKSQAGDNSSGFDFRAVLAQHRLEVNPISVSTLQLNITRQCNQACTHCHIEASPNRTERMVQPVIERFNC